MIWFNVRFINDQWMCTPYLNATRLECVSFETVEELTVYMDASVKEHAS